MVRRSAWIVLLTALPLASSARAEVPLDKLTTEQIRERLKKGFDDMGPRPPFDKMLAKPGIPFTVVPDEIEYSYTDGKPRLVWRYHSPAPLGGDQAEKVREALQGVLGEALVQTGLLTKEDGATLAKALEIQPAFAPPKPNSPPTISRIDDVTARAGEPFRLGFTVDDKESPPALLTVVVRSSDPKVLPPAQLVVTGEGRSRELRIAPLAGTRGSAQVTVTVTDPGGLSASSTFWVRVMGAGGERPEPPPNRPSPPPSSSSAPAYVLVPCAVWGSCGCGPLYYYYAAVAVAPSPGPAVSQALSAAAPALPQQPAVRVASAAAESVRRPDPPAPVRRPRAPRKGLVAEMKAGDWEIFYNPGCRAFWTGNYAAATEYLAAAAELGDDPRAWSFLALSLLADGDEEAGREAARYAAARVFVSPRLADDVNEALSRVQGPLRAQLRQFQSEVNQEQVARAVLAARPKLFLDPVRNPATAMTTNRAPVAPQVR